MCVRKKKTQAPTKYGSMVKCKKCKYREVCEHRAIALNVAIPGSDDPIPIMNLELLVPSCELRKRLCEALLKTVEDYKKELKKISKKGKHAQ